MSQFSIYTLKSPSFFLGQMPIRIFKTTFLLFLSCPPPYIMEQCGNTCLHELLLKNSKGNSIVESITKMLLKPSTIVNLKTKEGATPLHICAQKDHLEVGRLLIRARANVNLGANVVILNRNEI